MTEDERDRPDVAPGAPHSNIMSESLSYIIGLGLALLLTGISFWVASTSVLTIGSMADFWRPRLIE